MHPRTLFLAGLVCATLIRPSLAAEENWSLCRIPSFLFVADEDLARQTLALGAADFILKPFDLGYLETSVVAKLLAMGRVSPGPS